MIDVLTVLSVYHLCQLFILCLIGTEKWDLILPSVKWNYSHPAPSYDRSSERRIKVNKLNCVDIESCWVYVCTNTHFINSVFIVSHTLCIRYIYIYVGINMTFDPYIRYQIMKCWFCLQQGYTLFMNHVELNVMISIKLKWNVWQEAKV